MKPQATIPAAVTRRFSIVVALCAALLLLLPAGCSSAGPKAATDVSAQNRKLGRGVNILGADPIWRSRANARFRVEYFRMLKQAGFDSVRVNLQPFRYMDLNATNGWTVRPSWFETLDWVANEAQAQGLTVILDLHEYGPMGNDPEGNKAKFLAFWRQAAAHYQKAPPGVVFEVLNEPTGKLNSPIWNQYLKEALAIIRVTNPTRTVIVGPTHSNGINSLPDLELPDADRNLIVTVHYYSPLTFTHQGASWAGLSGKVGIAWLGTEQERAAISGDFDKANRWAQANRRPLFLGEFGAYDQGAMDSRARWTSAVARAAEARGWSWAYWQFDSDFILYDINRGAWVEPILHALVPVTPPGGIAH